MSINDYIEYREYYYDGDDPNFCNWIEIEGMGYGWLWCRKPAHKWRITIIKSVLIILNYMINQNNEHHQYYVYYEDGAKCYHFVDERGYRQDFVIRLSNKELYF